MPNEIIRRVLLGLIALESLSAFTLSVFGIYAAIAGPGEGDSISGQMTTFLVVFGLIVAGVLALGVRGLAQNKRAARAPVLLTQVFAILIAGQSALQNPSMLNIVVLLVACVVTVLLVLHVSRAEPATPSGK